MYYKAMRRGRCPYNNITLLGVRILAQWACILVCFGLSLTNSWQNPSTHLSLKMTALHYSILMLICFPTKQLLQTTQKPETLPTLWLLLCRNITTKNSKRLHKDRLCCQHIQNHKSGTLLEASMHNWLQLKSQSYGVLVWMAHFILYNRCTS